MCDRGFWRVHDMVMLHVRKVYGYSPGASGISWDLSRVTRAVVIITSTKKREAQLLRISITPLECCFFSVYIITKYRG